VLCCAVLCAHPCNHATRAVLCCVHVQVVIIAAGYDTRAYRLGKPGVRFYEIDLPHASRHKQELVRKLLPASKVCYSLGS
jgi:O-methyltransferase involved in polyketide biosynthesis